MPQEWQQVLDDNGITRAEQQENPDKVSYNVHPNWIELTEDAGPRRGSILSRS